MSKFFWKQLAWLWLSAFIVILDQLSKKIAMNALSDEQASELFPFFNFSLAFNRGAAFSFLNTASGWQNVFFVILACSFSLVLVVWLLRSQVILEKMGVSLIIGGAIGNLIDRCRYGFVVDFIDWHVGAHHWPTFNVADSAICLGVFFLLLQKWPARKG